MISKSNTILTERLKSFEEEIQKQTFQQYFPDPGNSTPLDARIPGTESLSSILSKSINQMSKELSTSIQTLSSEISRLILLHQPKPEVATEDQSSNEKGEPEAVPTNSSDANGAAATNRSGSDTSADTRQGTLPTNASTAPLKSTIASLARLSTGKFRLSHAGRQ